MIKKLLKIYPDMQWVVDVDGRADVFNIPFNGGYYLLDKANLSTQEEALVSLLINKGEIQSDWEKFINTKEPVPYLKGEGNRLIQIHFMSKPESPSLWIDTFSSLFENPIESLSNENDYFLIVGDKSVDLNQISSQIQTMDDDFSSKESIYIGEYYREIDTLNACVVEELSMFRTLKHLPKIHSYQTHYLQHFVTPRLLESEIAKRISQNISSDDDDVQLIQTLWENQNNLTISAQKLYVHRNTINYRIEKFQESKGLNLRDNHDLLFCYLLTIK